MTDFRKTIDTKDGKTTKTIVVNTERDLTMEQSSNGHTSITTAPPKVKSPLPDTTTIGTLGVLVAVVVWGALEAVKLLLKGWKEKTKKKTPWFWASALRFSALALGGTAGTFLYGTLGGAGDGWPWGTAIGIGAGALCTIVVGVLKRRIKALGQS